jgi:hypothetical protein
MTKSLGDGFLTDFPKENEMDTLNNQLVDSNRTVRKIIITLAKAWLNKEKCAQEGKIAMQHKRGAALIMKAWLYREKARIAGDCISSTSLSISAAESARVQQASLPPTNKSVAVQRESKNFWGSHFLHLIIHFRRGIRTRATSLHAAYQQKRGCTERKQELPGIAFPPPHSRFWPSPRKICAAAHTCRWVLFLFCFMAGFFGE